MYFYAMSPISYQRELGASALKNNYFYRCGAICPNTDDLVTNLETIYKTVDLTCAKY